MWIRISLLGIQPHSQRTYPTGVSYEPDQKQIVFAAALIARIKEDGCVGKLVLLRQISTQINPIIHEDGHNNRRFNLAVLF
jgi:hypothetical protein